MTSDPGCAVVATQNSDNAVIHDIWLVTSDRRALHIQNDSEKQDWRGRVGRDLARMALNAGIQWQLLARLWRHRYIADVACTPAHRHMHSHLTL